MINAPPDESTFTLALSWKGMAICCVTLGEYRYSMSVKRPSGGTKDSCLSRVHRCILNGMLIYVSHWEMVKAHRTHGWKEQSVRFWELVKLSDKSGVPVSNEYYEDSKRHISLPDSLELDSTLPQTALTLGTPFLRST